MTKKEKQAQAAQAAQAQAAQATQEQATQATQEQAAQDTQPEKVDGTFSAFDTIITAMFGAQSNDLPDEVVQGVKDPIKSLSVISVGKKGEAAETVIHNVSDIDCIGRINAAAVMDETSNLVIAANLSYLWETGAYDRYSVSSAEGLAKALGLKISAQTARKCMKVGQKFLSIGDDNKPVYKVSTVPHFGVFTLDYLCGMVDEVKDEAGKFIEFDYSRLNAWIMDNNINERMSQSKVRALLPASSKVTKEKKNTKQASTATDPASDPNNTAEPSATTINTNSPEYVLVRAKEALSALVDINGDTVKMTPDELEKIGDVLEIINGMIAGLEASEA